MRLRGSGGYRVHSHSVLHRSILSPFKNLKFSDISSGIAVDYPEEGVHIVRKQGKVKMLRGIVFGGSNYMFISAVPLID